MWRRDYTSELLDIGFNSVKQQNGSKTRKLAFMKHLAVVGWKPGFQTISFIKLLRQSGARKMTLPDAKACLDQILAGKPLDLYFDSGQDIGAFIREAGKLGAITSDVNDISDGLMSTIHDSAASTETYAQSAVIEYRYVDVKDVAESDMDLLAEAWLACWRLPMNSPERAKLQWITVLEYDLLEDAPEKLWLLILAIHSKDQSTRAQEVLSSGPLEDLLGRYGASFIDRVEKQTRIDPRFANLLGGVWKGAMSEEIWSRVQAVWNRRGWDGIPE